MERKMHGALELDGQVSKKNLWLIARGWEESNHEVWTHPSVRPSFPDAETAFKFAMEHEIPMSEVQVKDLLMRVLHDIAGAYFARRALSGGHTLTAPLRRSMERKAWTDEDIEYLCLELWEFVALRDIENNKKLAGETT